MRIHRSARNFQFLTSALVGLICLSSLGQEPNSPVPGTIVVPNGLESRPGNASNDTPFKGFDTYILQVYDASQLSPLSQGGFLTGVAFRTEEGLATGFDATYSLFEVSLATFPQPIEMLPQEYVASAHADSTAVFSRQQLRLNGTPSTSALVPAPFDIHIEFDRPFYYDSTVGHLLMYLRAGTLLSGREVRADYDDSHIPPLGRVTGGVIGGPFLGPGTGGIVAQFDYTAVPEPSVFALSLIWGCIALITYVARHRDS